LTIKCLVLTPLVPESTFMQRVLYQNTESGKTNEPIIILLSTLVSALASTLVNTLGYARSMSVLIASVVLKLMKYPLLRFLLSTVGRLSEGIRLGWRTGFDSGVMLEYVYQNQPKGWGGLGRFLDKQYLSHPVWDGVRSRRQLLIQHLQTALTHYPKPQVPVVFDMAAGVGSYLFEIEANRAQFIAGDFAPEAVAAGEQKAKQLNRPDICFKPNNAFEKESLAVQAADVLICSGFFDILVDEAEIHKVLANGSAITQEGARWVFTIQEHHPDLKLLKETMVDLHQKAWELVPRSAEQLIAWAAPYGWVLESLERNAYFAVGTLRRQHLGQALSEKTCL
jgi:SAM-dependent methyltransferase